MSGSIRKMIVSAIRRTRSSLGSAVTPSVAGPDSERCLVARGFVRLRVGMLFRNTSEPRAAGGMRGSDVSLRVKVDAGEPLASCLEVPDASLACKRPRGITRVDHLFGFAHYSLVVEVALVSNDQYAVGGA